MCEDVCQASGLHMSRFSSVQGPCSYDKLLNIIIRKFKAFANYEPFKLQPNHTIAIINIIMPHLPQKPSL
jgi:hypothetical protein